MGQKAGETGAEGKAAGTENQLAEVRAGVAGVKQRHGNLGWAFGDKAEKNPGAELTLQFT